MFDLASDVIPKCFVLVYICIVAVQGQINGSLEGDGFSLRAYISQHGLRGEVTFTYRNATSITVRTSLTPTLEFPDQVWRWSVRALPVDYTDLAPSRCSEDNLGEELIDLTEELGYLIIPGNDNVEYESLNTLTGPLGLWGRSLVLENAERDRLICSSILPLEIEQERYAFAKFGSPVAGTLRFRFLTPQTNGDHDAYILADLYHTRAMTEKVDFTEHKWKIFATDVFDADKGNHEDNCDVLQQVFDPKNSGEGTSVGDLDSVLGPVKVASDPTVRRARVLFKSEVISALRKEMESTKRSLYVVLFDHRHQDNFLACAKLRPTAPKVTRAQIFMSGLRGFVELTQATAHDPTWLRFAVGSAGASGPGDVTYLVSAKGCSVRELPRRLPPAAPFEGVCASAGALYNPTGVDLAKVPPAGMGSQDQYAVGDLLGKHRAGAHGALLGRLWDAFLPLRGRHSVAHRTLLIERYSPTKDACGILILYEWGTEYETPMTSAEVIFRYPIVGRVVLRQPQARHWEDTTIIIETMVHADGSNMNSTHEHRWAVHEHAPGRDFYNWSQRCVSAGRVYEPLALDTDARHPETYCRPGLEGLCRVGDLSTRHGTLSVAGGKAEAGALTRRLFTDGALPLAGRYSVLRRSLVIYDEHGPVARGERMACSLVGGLHRRKAVVRDWFGNGEPVPVRGRVEFTQQSEYDVTNIEVSLEGLEDVSNYSIHVTPVERDLDFPCERSSLLDVFNPYNVSKSTPYPAKGSPDEYPVGELGSLFGRLGGRAALRAAYNDTLLSLHGPTSILGRSIILHKMSRVRRWACSSVERGYSPAEARELRAIVSFHHPRGFAHGYIRMTQLAHSDGSYSDTVIEVKLRHPGLRDLNHTRNHNWEIFVNGVGVDATVKVTNTRCVAGGYRWNPYFTQLADPLNHELYRQECGADNPLRCDAGDIGARLGPIHLGGERQMFMDSNLPLEGPVSAMGRAIVIFGPEGSSERLACANIEPDSDIIKYFNILKPPSFILRSFLDEVRQVMGVPEWMLGVDTRRSRELHRGSCLQILLHFMGPHANKLEYDFSSLMASGRLDSPSIYIPGHVDSKRKRTIAYRQCEVSDPNEKRKKTSSGLFAPGGSVHVTPHALLVCTLGLALMRRARA